MLPCENCITLPICRAEIIRFYKDSRYQHYGLPVGKQGFKLATLRDVISGLRRKCIIFNAYFPADKTYGTGVVYSKDIRRDRARAIQHFWTAKDEWLNL